MPLVSSYPRTSCGHAITQPAHPVHSPVVTTSLYKCFHENFSGAMAAESSTLRGGFLQEIHRVAPRWSLRCAGLFLALEASHDAATT